jgi:protein required for attachment to host cells
VTQTCILVAGGAQARFFRVMESAGAPHGFRLQEIAMLADAEARERDGLGQEAGDIQHEPLRLEQERRFVALIVERTVELVEHCRGGRMLLITEPRLLGLLREPLRHALRSEVRLEELARDCSALSIGELEHTLAKQGLIP